MTEQKGRENLKRGEKLRASGGLWMSGEMTDEKTVRGKDSLRRQFVPKVQSSTLPTPSSCSPSARLLP